jgi:hypothetical protein
MKSKITRRREKKLICHNCRSPDYIYLGKPEERGFHNTFECNSCKEVWCYGTDDDNDWVKLA